MVVAPPISHHADAPPTVALAVPSVGSPSAAPQGQRAARRDGVKKARPQPNDPGIVAAADPMHPTLFHQPWWLDVVTRKNWSEISVESGGRTVARLPLHITRKWSVEIFSMPQLTNSLGPALDEGSGSANTRQLRRMDLMAELIEKLPPLHHFGQCFHRGISEVMAFQAAGFRTSPQFTVEVLPQPEEVLWQGLRDKTRNVICKTREKSALVKLDDPEEFIRFYRANLESQNLKSYFDVDLVKPLFEAAAARGCAAMRAMRADDGALLAANLVVNDAQRSYYLLTSRKAGHEDNGAASLLIWDAILEAAKAGRVFDFDGISSNGTARFYAGFGGLVVPRYTVFRSSKRFEAMKVARSVVLDERYNFFCPTKV